MIKYVKGDLLLSDAQALVNAVNTVGISGKGIALKFKQKFPLNDVIYRTACFNNEVRVGRMFITNTVVDQDTKKYIINFPTKQHWRDRSRLEWIVDGLRDLQLKVMGNGITSIAIPKLGCGNGGLNWKEVKPYIENTFSPLEGVTAFVYE